MRKAIKFKGLAIDEPFTLNGVDYVKTRETHAKRLEDGKEIKIGPMMVCCHEVEL
jgi:hypothetical protein